MGYTTDFYGEVTVDPPLNEHEVSYLLDFSSSRRMRRTKGPLYAQPGSNFGQDNAEDVLDYNRPPDGQPGLWCQWGPSDDGAAIGWDGGEKFYCSVEWMSYLIDNLLDPSAREFINAHLSEDERLKHFTCDHVLNGLIEAQGEEPSDRWAIRVMDNKVTTEEAVTAFSGEAGRVVLARIGAAVSDATTLDAAVVAARKVLAELAGGADLS